MPSSSTYDVVVIGAGVFGAWTAWHLVKRKQRVLLLDSYGVAHSRASSGGETRIIRMSYGADEIYTRWSQRSLPAWSALFEQAGEVLFHPTGVLWLAGSDDAQLRSSAATLQRCGIPFEVLENTALEKRYPQMHFADVTRGLLESQSGVLMARRAVACVVQDALRLGTRLKIGQVTAPVGANRVAAIQTSSGERVSAGQFVFACGAWLGKVFPALLSSRIFPTRQEVFFFGTPAGDARFSPGKLPTWLFQADQAYGMPDIEGRGLKLAGDMHGDFIDPDTHSRVASTEGIRWAQNYVARRFPALRDAPIIETRVCHYENTWNGDFLIDRHPDFENVWLAGGGSGHGFKHGPALGEYLAQQMAGEGTAQPRFSLASKRTHQKRAVF